MKCVVRVQNKNSFVYDEDRSLRSANVLQASVGHTGEMDREAGGEGAVHIHCVGRHDLPVQGH